MTASWRWYWLRLRVMNPGELAHRLRGRVVQLGAARRVRQAQVPPVAEIGLGLLKRLNEVYRCAWDPGESIHVFSHRVPWQEMDWLKNPQTGERVEDDKPDYRRAEQVGDVKLLWEQSRFKEWLAWAEAGEFARIVQLAQSWRQQNPPFVGIQWTSALEAGIRSIVLARVLALAVDKGHRIGPAASADQAAPTAPAGQTGQNELVQVLAQLIYWNGCFIAQNLSAGSSANNHLLGEALGLYVSGLVFAGTPEGKRWIRTGKRSFLKAYLRQTDDSGTCREGSLYYQCYVADMGLLYCLLTPATLELLRRRVVRVIDSILWWSTWSNLLPLIGDDDGGILTPHGESPDYYAPYGELRRLRDAVLPDVPSDPLELFSPPDFARLDAGNAGQFFIRIGPFGMRPLYAHSHADLGAVIGYRQKQEVLVDPGTGRYFEQEGLRTHLRSAAAHNTVADDSCNTHMNGPFMWVRPPQRVRVTQSAQAVSLQIEAGSLRIERHVSVERDVGLTVSDIVHNPQRKPVQQTWNLAPGFPLRKLNDSMFELQLESCTGQLQFSTVAGGEWDDMVATAASAASTPVAAATASTVADQAASGLPYLVQRTASRRYNVMESVPAIVRTSTLERIQWHTALTLPNQKIRQ